ncbi:hypothetical protein [Rubritalea tangerina]|uniref:Schlafen AlbA-2 domain-containing protein n=1 Tax=Rubritalea tangerina TaxID=430798 RepID=A0ABW4ZGI1_9BACT
MKSETTSNYLDKIYTYNTQESKDINNEIEKHTQDSFFRQFCRVFDELDKTISTSNKTFKDLVFTKEKKKVTQVFQVIFISFYNLLIQQNKIIHCHQKLAKQLEGVYDSHLLKLGNREKWNKVDRINLANSIIGLIQQHFIPRKSGDHSIAQWGQRLEVLINQSKTEQANYDFKIGLCTISKTKQKIQVSKIIKTLVAMTNSCKGDCYIIVGVADTQRDADELPHGFRSGSV